MPPCCKPRRLPPYPGRSVEVSEKELIAHCRERLGGFETPKAVVFVDALPETVGGKILRYKLRREHKALFESSS